MARELRKYVRKQSKDEIIAMKKLNKKSKSNQIKNNLDKETIKLIIKEMAGLYFVNFYRKNSKILKKLAKL